MLTTTVTRLGGRTHQSRSGSSSTVVLSSAALIHYRSQQHRTFRFARIWASCLDPEPHRDVIRHHRKLRHKYAETLNRRLSWDDHPHADDAKRVFKASVRQYWRKNYQAGSSRHASTGAAGGKTPDNPTGIRPGNNIEDAERGAMEHLLFGEKTIDDWASTFLKSKSRLRHKQSPPAQSSTATEQADELDYTIDPITNRKVPKSTELPTVPDVASPAIYSTDAGLEIPGHRDSGYEAQFTPFNPPSVPDSQEPIFLDGPPPEAELEKYGPVKLDPITSQSAGHNQPSQVTESQEYEKAHAQPAVSWHLNDGITSVKDVSGLARGVKSWVVSSDGLGYDETGRDDAPFAGTVAQVHDDLAHSKPVALEEADVGNAQAQQQYTDLPAYKPFHYLEPDGKPAEKADTDRTSEAVENQPFGLERPVPAEVNDQPDASAGELNNYKPFGYNEPDGTPASATAGSNDYDPEEVQRYQAFRYNEPDGKPLTTPEKVQEYDPVEVASYQPVRYNEPDGKPLAPEEKYGHESAGPNEYQETSFSRPDDALGEEAPELDVREVESYKAVKHNEPDGRLMEQVDATAEALAEFDREQQAGRKMPYLEPTAAERAEDLDLLRASDVRATFSREPSEATALPRSVLESSMSRLAATSDLQDQEAVAAVRETKQRVADGERILTGNFVRDFPEEFAGSWTSTFTPEPLSRLDGTTEVSVFQPALDRQAKSSSVESELHRETAELAPRPAVGDPFSKEPQGLETSYVEECGAALESPIFVKQYGIEPASAADASTIASSEKGPETPAMYKVLAYDQTTQTVSIADTMSSNVSKNEPPLTPAEVLTKLSHPSHFLPHFGPLQEQGFEIVSGSGDVLVFRQMRHPESNKPSSATSQTRAPLVNPIDKTGSSALRFPDVPIGRFASPTGFVNYDDMYASASASASSSSSRSAGQFVSGIDVRREEDVFSGGRAESRSKERKKRASLPKRMAIGAAWVAGVSYALGVVGEYFKTGGMDGMGPKGF